jgi:hypothetical protein
LHQSFEHSQQFTNAKAKYFVLVQSQAGEKRPNFEASIDWRTLIPLPDGFHLLVRRSEFRIGRWETDDHKRPSLRSSCCRIQS